MLKIRKNKSEMKEFSELERRYDKIKAEASMGIFIG